LVYFLSGRSASRHSPISLLGHSGKPPFSGNHLSKVKVIAKTIAQVYNVFIFHQNFPTYFMNKLFLILLSLMVLTLSSCKESVEENIVTIRIGGLFSLTGNWSTLGLTSQEAMRLAVNDVNTRMITTGAPIRFAYSVYDTKLDPSLALQMITTAHNQRVHYLVGPQSSAELGAIREFANTNEMLVVSQSSTASSLAIPNDGIFRFCPGDAVEGAAMARTIYASGRRAIIVLSRDDAGNKGLQEVVSSVFTTLGGTAEVVTPYSASTTDFSGLLETVKAKIQQFNAARGPSQVGVYIASFDECADLFAQASDDPVLSSVQWYGGDGVTLSSALTSNAAAAKFAIATKFIAPSFGLPEQAHPDQAAIATQIKTKTNLEPDAYALAVYDAVWVLARTLSDLPENKRDFTRVKELFAKEANQFNGITGPIVLNAAGDRNAGSFDYWGITLENNTYSWKFVGKSN
jgi:branched-chain amino acid transport system substrate-binding protein